MNDFRYTFAMTKKDNFIYAIGGWVYGGDDVSLINKCEWYDLNTNKWTKIASMYINRVTSFALVYDNKIYALGGYTAKHEWS